MEFNDYYNYVKKSLQRGGVINRYAFLALIFISLGLAIVTFYIIAKNPGPFGPDPKKVLPLILIDILFLLALAAMISWRMTRLWLERKKGFAGSRLQTRIMIMFSLVSIAPAIVMAIFSVILFNFGVQAWFDSRVSRALSESVKVAQEYLEEHKENIRADILGMANDLNAEAPLLSRSNDIFEKALTAQASLRSLAEAVVFRGKDILARTDMSFSLIFEMDDLPEEIMKKAAEGEVVVLTSKDDDRVRAVIKLNNYFDTYLLVGRFVDNKVINHINMTKDSAAEYQKMHANIANQQIQFILIYVAMALLILFAALSFGTVFIARLVEPVSVLIKATEQVKAGNFETRVNEGAEDDEIGTLGRAFNRMAAQLQKNRSELVEVNKQIDSRRRLIEAVLAGVSAGVIALDVKKRISLFNRSAVNLLKMEVADLQDKYITHALPEITILMEKAEKGREQVVNGEISITRKDQKITFLVRIVKEEFSHEIEGYIVTFDDITELLTAQRTAAWADVARRIAHEIKNPLTPIHLSVERLKQKYRKEITTEPEVFEKYTDTILRHLGNIAKIVEEFANFARMPAPVMAKHDICEIIRDVVFTQKAATSGINYIFNIPRNKPFIINCDRNQITQVIINLVKNAVESIEEKKQKLGYTQGEITINIIESEKITVEIIDNGKGFPPDLLDRITEPYVTTKEKGTGLGLAIVKKVMDDHDGTLFVGNIKNEQGDINGGIVKLTFPFI